MHRSLSLLLAAASLSVVATAQAPIEHRYSDRANTPSAFRSNEPIAGVNVRSGPGSIVRTITADENVTEIRVERGRANVRVDHPATDVQILIDLPGGQTAITRDGLYTFNADTNTVHVLRGEAEAFPGNGDNSIKIREEQQLTFSASNPRAIDIDPSRANADLLPNSDRNYYSNRAPYGDGYSYAAPYYPYPYAYYPYPYYGYGYPFGFGLGFGYYGGFRGGYYGGFRGYRHR
jgi:hypothetical protein